MAARALLSVGTLVGIINPMAGVTVLRHTPITLIRVASTALHTRMSTSQRKRRGLMIEPDRFPACFNVATGALGSQLTLVPVIRQVTLHALHRRLGILDTWDVTGSARYSPVPSLQRVVCQIVIEGLAVKNNKRGVTSLVFGMATAAR